MFLRRNDLVTDVEHFQGKAFNHYRSAILNIFAAAWKEDSIRGKSYKYYLALQYTLAFYYVSLMYWDYIEGFYTKEELLKKYDYECSKKKFACNNIDLDLLMSMFNIKWEDYCVRTIQRNYVVGGEGFCCPKYTKADIMECECICTNFITDDHTITRDVLDGMVLENCEALLI